MKISCINNIQSVNCENSAQNKKNVYSRNPSHKYEQLKSISNIYYKPLSFGRSTKEHKSWGAYIDPETKETSFKILTYPDSKKVTVTVVKRDNENSKKTYELVNKGSGIFETQKKIPPEEVKEGDLYFYTIEKGNGDIDSVKDPYSYRQESLLGASALYDHSQFEWTDDDWYKNNPDRISRKANNVNHLTPLSNAKIYELNIASFTKKGSFDSAIQKLKSIKATGFNAIEIMPVENTYSFNWGYDGVDKFAPSEHLGGPDGLKRLIDAAHEAGLNVIMDMVPNHLGPDGAQLLKTGPYIGGNNCFGESFNYEGENSVYVRDFIVNAALNWIDNYHCDGLRLDMTKYMESDYTMKQIAAEINYHHPHAFIIAEDSREHISVNDDGGFCDNYEEPHDKRITNPLKDFESGEGQSEQVHCRAIEQISARQTSLGRIGFDSEWDFNYFHSLKDCLYGAVNLDEFEKACYCAQNTVKYVMSHDEIGNFEGSRLTAKLMVPMLHLNDNIVLNSDDENRARDLAKLKNCSEDEAYSTVLNQKAQFSAEQLALMLQTGKLDKYNTTGLSSKQWISAIQHAFKTEVLEPLGIKSSSGITYDSIKTMYNKSINRYKMALARTYSIPGPKMVFQGDEKADLTPFRFFREFDSVKDEKNLYTEKGYNTGKEALDISTTGTIKYSVNGKSAMSKFKNLTKDLNKINAENPALTRGVLIAEDTVKHQSSQVFATHAKDTKSDNEIFAITNFNDFDYPRNDAAEYYINFPAGEWIEILNTDDKRYGGNGSHRNRSKIISDGKNNSTVNLPGDSTLLFKKIK